MVARAHDEEDREEEKALPIWKIVIFIVGGIAGIVIGGDLVVEAATVIAQNFGFSETFIGLTVVALGTSMPELFTSVTAARKGKADIAIGNIVGSNIFNILFVVGTSAIIIPITFASTFVIDCLVALAAGAILWVFVFKKRKLTRVGGIVMLVSYAAYFVYLLGI